jgi:hypothetical protein
MWINPVDDKNVVSFIHGYEAGTRRRDFTELLKESLTNKHRVYSSSDGWPGQVGRLSKKLSLNWTIAFKKAAIEVLVFDRHGDIDKAVTNILKKKIVGLIGRIESPFNRLWIDEWLSLCSIKDKWFKDIWTDKEWLTVKSIDKRVKNGT